MAHEKEKQYLPPRFFVQIKNVAIENPTQVETTDALINKIADYENKAINISSSVLLEIQNIFKLVSPNILETLRCESFDDAHQLVARVAASIPLVALVCSPKYFPAAVMIAAFAMVGFVALYAVFSVLKDLINTCTQETLPCEETVSSSKMRA